MASVPAGHWGVAVSGGADSVALLRLAMLHRHLHLHVIHLDHETRAGESAADAAFVRSLADDLDLPYSGGQLSELGVDLSDNNTAARFRAARLAWYAITVKTFSLDGVLLAHHRDDQAETVAQRLTRGRQPEGLGGMSSHAIVDGVRMLRPLLGVCRDALRKYLIESGQRWVEDSSNASPIYQRNRIRKLLAGAPDVSERFVNLSTAAQSLSRWLDRVSPVLSSTFDSSSLATLPTPIARHSAGDWLRRRGVPASEISRAVCDRLIELARDAASAQRLHFPGPVVVTRIRGRIG